MTKTGLNTSVKVLLTLSLATAAALLSYYYFAVVTTVPVANKNFSSTDFKSASFNLNIKKPIYDFRISAGVKFNNFNFGLVRIILVDKDNKEYLVYEGYPAAIDNIKLSLNNSCQETCRLNGIIPVSLKIITEDAEVALSGYSYSDSPDATKGLDQKAIKAAIESQKIENINKALKRNGGTWVAGQTKVSQLSYEDKKKLLAVTPDGKPLADLPNLMGFEYYTRGIFIIKSKISAKSIAKSVDNILPENWDWRNVHGKDYITSVKDQGKTGNCWAFSDVGTIEAQINLFYNQNLNLDLSEQQIVDCRNDRNLGYAYFYDNARSSSCSMNGIMDYINWNGITDEACDLYVTRDTYACSMVDYNPIVCETYLCSDWQKRTWHYSGEKWFWFKNAYYGTTPECLGQVTGLDVDDVKRVLIHEGPISTLIRKMNHSMVLVGYKKVTSQIANSRSFGIVWDVPQDYDTIDYTALIGKDVWIFKNSWGLDNTGRDDNGYARFIIEDMSDSTFVFRKPVGPFIPPVGQSYKTVCEDKDKDGFYNWGSGSDKSGCPAQAKSNNYKDADDNNKNITCIPYCVGLTCGSDGCGGSCGSCSSPSICLGGACASEAVCRSGQLIGDVNDDGLIDQTDREYIGNIKVGIIATPTNKCCADLNVDGRIDSADGIIISQIMAGSKSRLGLCQ